MKLVTTKQFDRAVKDLKKKHNNTLLNKLAEVIIQIYTDTIPQSDHPHKLSGKHTNGIKDVHIDGDHIVLYRYDPDSDTLVVSAKLHDIVKHDDLSNRDTFKEKQGFEQNFDEYINNIRSSSQIYDPIDFDYVDEWFTDYYNEVISQVICIDDIVLDSISDKGDYLVLKCSGYQYRSSVPLHSLNRLNVMLNAHCRQDGVICKLIPDTNKHCFDDPDSYGLTLFLDVKLTIMED